MPFPTVCRDEEQEQAEERELEGIEEDSLTLYPVLLLSPSLYLSTESDQCPFLPSRSYSFTHYPITLLYSPYLSFNLILLSLSVHRNLMITVIVTILSSLLFFYIIPPVTLVIYDHPCAHNPIKH